MLAEHHKPHVLYELPWHCWAMEDIPHSLYLSLSDLTVLIKLIS